MGEMVTLTAADGHSLSAWRADPAGTPKGAVIVGMEIFGITDHVKRLTDSYAAKGYTAIAPALFDRLEPGSVLGYDGNDYAKGRALKDQVDDDGILADVQACADAVASAGKVGVVGYCFGGYVAWITGTGLDSLACSVVLYGGGIAQKADMQPKCPMQMHWGDKDRNITMGHVQAIREAHPDIPSYVYDDAAHGFCTNDREGAYNPGACERAHERIFAFLGEHLG